MKNRTPTILVLLLGIIHLCPGLSAASDNNDDPQIRKKLFLLERHLERVSEQQARENAFKLSVNAPGPAERIDASLESATRIGNSGAAAAQHRSGQEQKDFGGVTAKLDGGSLTGFSYSGTGLDLTEFLGGNELVLLLQSNEIDISDLDRDENMNDRYASSNRDEFFGLKEYRDMQNLFAKQAPGKDYTMTGFGTTLDLGAYSLGMINYSKPPRKKKKIFFGNDSAGPYQIGATDIIPGSETVRLGGAELVKGAHYDINYSRGEITFDTPIAMSDRVVIEYELMQSGSGAPGRFTGFRFQMGEEAKDARQEPASDDNAARPKRFELERWGLSYLNDEVITYHRDGDAVRRGYRENTLMGIDGAFAVGGSTEIGLEYAQSSGDKSRETGRFASATLTIADSRASDGSPDGPYYLDDTTLPIMENTEEVRVNGALLERDADYSLDLTYGFLRLKKTDLDLGPRDIITVTYRYLAESGRYDDGAAGRDDSAYKFSMKNGFGRFTHAFETSQFGRDFLQVGGTASNQLINRNQTLDWSSGNGLNISHKRGLVRTLRDRDAGIDETSETQSSSLNYKWKDRYSFSYETGAESRYDNLASHHTDTTRRNAAWRMDVRPGEKYKIGYSRTLSDTINAGSSPSSQRNEQQTLTFSAKPFKSLSFDTTQTHGSNEQNSPGVARTRDQSSSEYKIRYKPSSKWNLAYDLSTNGFSGAATDARTAASATDTITTANFSDPPTGNRASNLSVNISPSENLSVTARLHRKNEATAGGGNTMRRDSYDIRKRINEKIQLQYRVNTMENDRSGQSYDTAMQALILRANLGILPGGMDLDVKRERQDSDIAAATAAGFTDTTIRGRTTSITLTAEPFWEGKKLSLEWRGRTGRNRTNGLLTFERETRRAMSVDVPFIGDSALQFSWSGQSRSGTRATRQRDFGLTLSGQLTRVFDLQLSYKTQTYTDTTTPSASTRSGDLNIVLKGQREW